jgi:hypothetical protein
MTKNETINPSYNETSIATRVFKYNVTVTVLVCVKIGAVYDNKLWFINLLLSFVSNLIRLEIIMSINKITTLYTWVINRYLFLSLCMFKVWYRSMFWLNDKESLVFEFGTWYCTCLKGLHITINEDAMNIELNTNCT